MENLTARRSILSMVHAQELGRSQLGDCRLALIRHGAGQEIARHGHEHGLTHVVLRGLYVECSAAGTVVACPGDVVFKEPQVEHSNHFGSIGAESLRFELPGDAAPEVKKLVATGGAADIERLLRLARRLRGGDAAPTTASPPRDSPQAKLLVRLRRRFRSRLVLGELARKIGVDRCHLTRQFTREFGCSPQTYVTLKRVAWTAQELARGGDTMGAIALAAGFADQSHCIRAFKRAFGATPSRWSREVRL
jgi:AraC-like DNA-binding protein